MRVRRVPAVDELQRGDERLVLVSDRAVRLVGLAPAILDLTEGWRALEDLTAELEIRFGTPLHGGADELVRIAVSDLAAAGLIEVRDP
jgi:hypothetical protein